MLRTAMIEIGQRMGVSQVEVQLGAPALQKSATMVEERASKEVPSDVDPLQKQAGGNGYHE